MAYISVRSASEKWGVHARAVQAYCKAGRIPYAQKYGNCWMIPADAEKPDDPRKAQKAAQTRSFDTLPRRCPLLTMTALYSTPGSGDAVAETLKEDDAAYLLFRGQLSYLRGDIAGAAALLKALPYDSSRPDLCIGIGFLQSLCALYNGDTEVFRTAKQKLEQLVPADESQQRLLRFWLCNIELELYDISGFPAWFCEGDFAPLPEDCQPMARYSYMKYHMLRTMKSEICLITKPFITQNRIDGALVSEIYCRLMLAVGYHEQGSPVKAAEQIDMALSLALPDRLFAPFAEYRDNLETLLDDRISLVSKAASRFVKQLSTQLSGGWATLKREIYGMINTTSLTQQEHYTAKLAAKGLTNAEIATRMKVSVNTVRGHMREIISKTGVKSRRELSEYLAMEFTNT